MAGAFGTGIKNSVFGYLFNDLDLDVSNGLCVKHDDPDLWFAGEAEKEFGEKWTYNREQRQKVALEVDKATQALAICNNCPAKVNCLELGMRGTQIYYGIYGGTMPGERLLKLGRSMKKAEYANTVNFAKKVRRTMRERGISG
jgi:hypothetical protein